MNIISFFDFNNKKYVLLEENTRLLFCIKEDNHYRFNISNNEKNLFSYIISSITPSLEKSCFIKRFSYNDSFYNLYFDAQKNLYYTDTSNINLISYVNFKYNNMPDLYYNSNNGKVENDTTYFKRFIKMGKKFICIFALSTISLSNLSSCSISLDKNIFNIYNETSNQIYDFTVIENFLNNNPYLTNEDKNFIKQLQFVFDENHEYMDIDMVNERLSSLKINYIPDSRKNCSGSYNFQKNEINLYNCTDFNNCDIPTFIHEFLHVLQKPSNNLLMELSNELFALETTRRLYDNGIISKDKLENIPVLRYGNGYEDYMPTYYVLANLLDEKTLREYQFGCDPYTIIEGLSRSENKKFDTKRAEEFIVDINLLRNYNKESKSYDYVDNIEKLLILSNCYNHLNYYCKLKNGYAIKDNLQIAINYLHCPTFYFEIPYTFQPYTPEEIKVLENMLSENSYNFENESIDNSRSLRFVTPKEYLNNTHKNPILSFLSNNLITTEITEDFAKNFYEEIKKIEKSNNTSENYK